MPNHIHGILVITERMTNVETPRRGVSTRSKWKPGTLGAIINQFKSISTKRIRHAGTNAFAWQPRFHDHIIRNEDALFRIRTYIQNNPQKWEFDKYFRWISSITSEKWMINILLAKLIFMSKHSVKTPRRGVFTILKWKPGTLGAIINTMSKVNI